MSTELEFEMGVSAPTGDTKFDNFWASLAEEFDQIAITRSARNSEVRKALLAKSQGTLDAMDLIQELGIQAVNWASEETNNALENDQDTSQAMHFNALIGLAGRALLAFDEVTWLLRGGYPAGAWTRMRTLHELFAVAATLGIHGQPDGEHPDLLQRYIDHHEAFTHSTAEDLLETGIPSLRTKLDSTIMTRLKKKRSTLLEHYGKGFGTGWGWAAPLFPGSNPSFTALSKLLTPNLTWFYGEASSHVHASSQGLSKASQETEDSDQYYLAGPQRGNGSIVAALSSTLLVGLLGAAIPVSIKSIDKEVNTDGYYFLAALDRICDQIREPLGETNEE